MGTPEEPAELFDLRMSEEAKPLYERVVRLLEEVVAPMQEEYFRLGENRETRWEHAPGQPERLDSAKDTARQAGPWNFFLPAPEVGVLSNLAYAHTPVESPAEGLS